MSKQTTDVKLWLLYSNTWAVCKEVSLDQKVDNKMRLQIICIFDEYV